MSVFGDIWNTLKGWFGGCAADFCDGTTALGGIDPLDAELGGGIMGSSGVGSAGGGGGGGGAYFTATGLGKADVAAVSTPPFSLLLAPPAKSGTNNKAPVCFAQLKSRPVNDPTASKVDALHTFWWVQGTNGRAILSAGRQSYQGGSNPYLEAWVVPGNSNGADNSGQHLVFNTGVSGDVCGQVDLMINSASQFPRRSIYYNPVWGPNSNTAAKYFGNTAGFQPSFPFNAYGSGAPLLVP